MSYKVNFRAYSKKWAKMIHHNVDGYIIDVLQNTAWTGTADDECIELMQSLCKNDMKGVEAFVGDIILVKGSARITKAEYLNQLYVLEYDEMYCKIFAKPLSEIHSHFHVSDIPFEAIILGNIYENKNLLKQSVIDSLQKGEPLTLLKK